MIRRLAVVGLALAAVTAVAGCKENATTSAPAGTTGAPSASPSATPQERLAAATRRLGENSVKVTMTMGSTMSGEGRIDPRTRQATMTMSMSVGGNTLRIRMIMVGADAYTKIEGSPLGAALGGKWLHLDARKARSGQFGMSDPQQVKKMLSALSGLEADGPNSFSGTLDLAKAAPAGAKGPGATKGLGGPKGKVPFTARVDDQGRLTRLTMDMSKVAGSDEAGVGKIVVSYSDFGIPVSVHAPAKRDTRELPKQLSGLLGA